MHRVLDPVTAAQELMRIAAPTDRGQILAHALGLRAFFIDLVFVPVHLQRTGIGTAIYREWEARLEPHIEFVELMVLQREAVIRFWQSLGFVPKFDLNQPLSLSEKLLYIKGVNGFDTPCPLLKNNKGEL